MTFGSEPVEALYDYGARRIGPFRTQIEILFDHEASPLNTIPICKFYAILQRNPDAIAVWNVNNSTIAMLTKTQLYLRTPDGGSHFNNEPLPIWNLPMSLMVPEGKHIGWVRTYDKTKVVYHYPWYLCYNEESKRFLDCRFAKEEVKGKPKPNPPLSLYKELLETPYNAVYVDEETNTPIFMKGEF